MPLSVETCVQACALRCSKRKLQALNCTHEAYFKREQPELHKVPSGECDNVLHK